MHIGYFFAAALLVVVGGTSGSELVGLLLGVPAFLLAAWGIMKWEGWA